MADLNPTEKKTIEMADAIADALFPQLRPRPVRTNHTTPTPGDWKLKNSLDVVTFVDGSEYVIATIDADACLTEEEQIANGQLIAQSKVLAAIVRDLVKAWDKADSSALHSLIFRAKIALSLTEVR